MMLILDKDIQELRRLREILSREGFNIITATDMKTAEKLSEHFNFTFILGSAEILGFHGKER